MNDFESSFQSRYSLFISFPDVFNRILGCYYKPVILWGNSTSFCLQDTAIPVRPYLQLLPKTLMILTNVIHDDILLPLISIPPFVAQFGIVIGVVFPCLPGLSNARYAPDPDTSEMVSILDHHVVLLDPLEIPPMLYLNVCWNLVKFPVFSLLEDFFPISLWVPLNWLDTKGPRTF